MRKHINILAVILMLTLAAGLLASCSESARDDGSESGTVWDPGAAEGEEPGSAADGSESEEEYSPEPGDFIIGTMRDQYKVHQGLLSDYAKGTGVKVEIAEYGSDRELIEAARGGEIDLVAGNDLVNLILASEGSLSSLEPVLGKLAGTGEYYGSILDAGRINGELQIAIPYFRLNRMLGVPRGAAEALGREIGSMVDIEALYESLEKEYRASGVLDNYDLMIDAGIDLPGRRVDLSETVGVWRDFLRKCRADASEGAGGKQGSLLYTPGLFEWMPEEELPFYDIAGQEDRYAAEGGQATRFGSEAAFLPMPLGNSRSFGLYTTSGAVPKEAPHADAAMAYIAWVFSEEGQESILKADGGNDYPNCIPVRKDEAHKWIDSFSQYGDDASEEKREEMKAANRERADAYIAMANRLPASSNDFKNGIVNLISLRTADEEARKQQLGFISESANPVLYRYAAEMSEKEASPKFLEDGTFEDWAEYLESFVADYLADLGYEVAKGKA